MAKSRAQSQNHGVSTTSLLQASPHILPALATRPHLHTHHQFESIRGWRRNAVLLTCCQSISLHPLLSLSLGLSFTSLSVSLSHGLSHTRSLSLSFVVPLSLVVSLSRSVSHSHSLSLVVPLSPVVSLTRFFLVAPKAR